MRMEPKEGFRVGDWGIAEWRLVGVIVGFRVTSSEGS